ncbi:MAG TPA: TIGR03088 family PEP-CTERM/XrtA system glycosyltransferase [Burkholderiaceae bacterium]|nr:TIGR03088 family PEP-CTERM/XrtA system glycosyltransferase [Burkholderiaceae bacterium]
MMSKAFDRHDPRPLIAHVVYRFDTGGLENGVVNLINALPHDRYRHAVVALTEIGAFRERVRRDDVQFIALHKKPGPGIKLAPALYQTFRALAPAVVHTRNLAALEAALPAALARVPVRIHGEHGWDVGDLGGTNRKNQLVRRVYRPFVMRHIALSQHLQAYLETSIGVPARAIAQIYNGVDTTRFKPANERASISGCPFGADHWLVGTVGRLEVVKDQLTLARAFVRAIQQSPAARERMRLVIVGNGRLRDDIAAVLKDGGVMDFAWFAGERGDVAEVMRGLDAFVLPSLAEGISNTVLEAMATGLPVIATAVGGNVELIEDAITGRLVPSNDPASLARVMLALFDDVALQRRLGAAARARVEQRFSLDRMVADYAAQYDALLVRAGYSLPRWSVASGA